MSTEISQEHSNNSQLSAQETSGSSARGGQQGPRTYYRGSSGRPNGPREHAGGRQHGPRDNQAARQYGSRDHQGNRQTGPKESRGDHQNRNRLSSNHEVDMRKYQKMIADAQNNFADIIQTEKVKEDCTICCKPNDLFGIGSCRHPVCIECAIRLRIICGQSTCPVCRGEVETMCFVFAKSDMTTIDLDAIPSTEHPAEGRYKIRFENSAAGVRYEKYLAHVCKLCKMEEGERKEFPSFVSLRQHMNQVHQLVFCHICTDNINLFSRERKTYTREQLQRHIKHGDPEDKSQKGHPQCLFCDERFFDQELQYRHLRKEHFFCQFCEAEGQMNIFYGKHVDLVAHYTAKHFVCDVPECKEAGIAFSNSFDLKVHQSKEHGNSRHGLSLDFNFSDRQLGGRGRGRGGHANREPQERTELPPATRGVIVVPAERAEQPPRDRSDFVVVPSAQHRGPIRFNTRPAYDTSANNAQFPSLPGVSRAPSTSTQTYAPRSANKAAKLSQAQVPPPAEAFPSLGERREIAQGPNQQWARHTGNFDVIDDDERRATATRTAPGPSSETPRLNSGKPAEKAQKVQRPVTDEFPALANANSQNNTTKNWAKKVAASEAIHVTGLVTHAQTVQPKKKKNKQKKPAEPYEPPEYIEPPEREWEEVPVKPKPIRGKNKQKTSTEKQVVVSSVFSVLDRNKRLSSSSSSEGKSDTEEDKEQTDDAPKTMADISKMINIEKAKEPPRNNKQKKNVAQRQDNSEEKSPEMRESTLVVAQPQQSSLFGGMFSFSGMLSSLASGWSNAPPPGLDPAASTSTPTNNNVEENTPTSQATSALSYGPPPGFEGVLPKATNANEILRTETIGGTKVGQSSKK